MIDEKYTLENLFSGNLTMQDIPDVPELINMIGATKGALARGVGNSLKGTYDTVKTLVTEPGKVWDAVSSGASDFIEHPIQNTKKFVSETCDNVVDAVWRSTPQDMAEDVGEIAGDVAVDALTAGSGAAITTGLKAGAKKLTISAGKTVAKTVTKTAGKTAVKEAGKKTIKELIPDVKTVKKWIPKELPTDEGWLKNVVTAGGDIGALKKNHYQAILPNDKKSIKDILQKTTQNTAKETAGEFAENKAVNLTKDKIAKETKKEIVEEVKDKAIDVTENKVVNAAKSEIKDEAKDKIVNEVKDKTVDIAKGKVVEEIKDVTQKIVNENSNRRGKNGVHTSPAVNETKVDKIKATRTDSNNIEKDKAPTNEQIPEAKIHEITHRRLSEKVKEIRNKFKELRKENEEIIPKHIAEHGNIAVAEIDIPGVPKEFMAHSSINTPNAKAAQYGTFVYKPKPEERNLKSYIKAATGTKGLTKEEILKKKRVDRYHDSEAKILENITSRIKDTPNVKGKIDLYTERDCCDSCKNLISEFRNKFPNIELNIYTDNF